MKMSKYTEKNTQYRPGDLTQNDRSETFVCLQTWQINRCNRSTVKAVNVLRQNGSIFVLTERFCQDPWKNTLVFTSNSRKQMTTLI